MLLQIFYIVMNIPLWAHFSITEPSIYEGQSAAVHQMNGTDQVQEETGDNNLYSRWSWTWNNPNRPPEEWLEILSDLPGAVRGVFQLERGAACTEHFQGYLEFASSGRKCFAWLKRNLFKDGQHFNRSRKPALANWRYCRKQDFWPLELRRGTSSTKRSYFRG